MSEYTNVEHPFLEKLREIGWKVIDKSNGRTTTVAMEQKPKLGSWRKMRR